MKPTLFFTLLLLAVSSPAVADDGDPLAEKRRQFVEAWQALSRGNRSRAAELVAGLEDYPLYIYYRHHDLSRNLHRASSEDVREFLAAYDGSLLATRLRRDWLKRLARSRRHDDLIRDYRPQSDTKLVCAHLTARIETGALEGVTADALRLWLVGESQPDECDRAFAFLEETGALDDPVRWRRIRLALSNNKPGLARYLARSLSDPGLRAAAEQWLAVHANPARALKQPFFDEDNPLTREIVVHGMRRLARTNVDAARAAWSRYESEFEFTEPDRGRVARILAVAAARQDHADRIALLDAVPADYVDDTVERYRIREGIKTGSWPELARWTDFEPVGTTNELRWRYWHARALEETERGDAAALVFRDLAKHRDYYGFLSADRIGLEYSMNDHRVSPTEIEIADVSGRAGVTRAREFFHIDMPFKARREWSFETDRMSKRELEVAAWVVNRWGWHDRAIFALGKAQSYDDLEIRFPVLHEQLVRSYAEKRELEPAVIYSIIRTESAFMDDARSSAGALGLMQVMPATGRETARRIGASLPTARGLLEPRKNVMIGSAYLKQVLNRFRGSFSMAAAAYNAGPHRVRAWLPESGCVPADIWVDTIPFTETRRYVRRASFYATVYQWRLGDEIERINTRLTSVDPKGKTQQC